MWIIAPLLLAENWSGPLWCQGTHNKISEPTWHRRSRRERSWARLLVRVSSAAGLLQAHHTAHKMVQHGNSWSAKNGGHGWKKQRPWQACAKCGPASWVYNHRLKADSVCKACGTAWQKQWDAPENAGRGNGHMSYSDACRMAMVKERYKEAQDAGNGELVRCLQEIYPQLVDKKENKPDPWVQYQSANQKFVSVQKKHQKAMDRLVQARISYDEAQTAAVQIGIELKMAEQALLVEREKYSSAKGLEAGADLLGMAKNGSSGLAAKLLGGLSEELAGDPEMAQKLKDMELQMGNFLQEVHAAIQKKSKATTNGPDKGAVEVDDPMQNKEEVKANPSRERENSRSPRGAHAKANPLDAEPPKMEDFPPVGGDNLGKPVEAVETPEQKRVRIRQTEALNVEQRVAKGSVDPKLVVQLPQG